MNTILNSFKLLQKFNNLYRIGEYSKPPLSYQHLFNANEINLSPVEMINIANIISNNFNVVILCQDDFSIEFKDDEDVLCVYWTVENNQYKICIELKTI